MSEDTRKDQEKKDELTEKDLDQASGGQVAEGIHRQKEVIHEAPKRR